MSLCRGSASTGSHAATRTNCGGSVRNQKRLVLAILALVAAAGAVPRSGYAQVLYGSVVGNVQDGSGAALPGATVTITSRTRTSSRTAVTNETGAYTLHQRAGRHV